MANPLARLLLGADEASRRERLRALTDENAELRRELAENRWLMEQWREELKGARAALGGHVDDAVASKLTYLFHELARPTADLAVAASKPAETDGGAGREVAELLGTLRKFGVVLLGKPGDAVTFDPDAHEVDAPGVDQPQRGAAATIERPGVGYKDRRLLKARVRAP